MENITVNRLMRLINPLSIELKLEILSKLSDSLKGKFMSDNMEKEKLLNELYGSWKTTSDDLVSDVYKSRVISDRNLSFD